MDSVSRRSVQGNAFEPFDVPCRSRETNEAERTAGRASGRTIAPDDASPERQRFEGVPNGIFNNSAPNCGDKTPDIWDGLARVRAHLCNSAWCPSPACRRRSSLALRRRLSWIDASRVWHIVLTVNRSRYADAEEAFEHSSSRIREFPRRLARLGHKVRQWVRILEWNNDGFPHYHFLVEFERSTAWLPFDDLRRAWLGEDTWVRAERVEGRRHWENLVGYGCYSGYLNGSAKTHQIVLPSWAESRETGTIRRWSSSRVPRDVLPSLHPPSSSETAYRAPRRIQVLGIQQEPLPLPPPRTYAEKHEECGRGLDLEWLSWSEQADKLVYCSEHYTHVDLLDVLEVLGIEGNPKGGVVLGRGRAVEAILQAARDANEDGVPF